MTGGDMRMKIGFSSHPGQSDFTQWLDAMKMVARLQDGIPTDFRKKLWLTLAERHLEQRGVNWKQAERICFDEWCNPDDEELGIQIVKDLHRTGCSLFCGAAGRDNQAVLRRVLLGFARWNKSVGYCQGLNVLAALVLQVVDREEASAVKVMIFLVEGVLPEGYFADNLRGLSVDMAVFRDLLRTRLPKLSRHLEALQSDAKDKTTGSSYEPPLTNVFTMQWFLTLFCHCLPQEAVLRIWDLIFLEGDEILLRTALAIWEGLSERIMSVTSADEFYSIMGVLTKEMLEFTDTNNLIKAIVSMGTLHGVTSLREKHRYNITPWTRKLSDDEDTDTDDDDRLAVAAAVFDRMPTSLGILQSAGHDRERLTLDITSLKQQYAKLRERQRQAHIILSAACARQSMVPTSQSPAMNHLLVGKSALVSNKGRQLTPSSVTTPLRAKLSGLLSPVAAQSRKAESRHQQSVTLHWKDTKKVKDHPGAAATATTITTTTTTTTVNTTNFNTTTVTATATAGVADAVAAVSAADADASVDPITADPAASTTISTANATIDDKKETLSGRSSAKLTVSPGRSTPSRRESLGSDSDSTSTELCDEFDYQSEDDSLEVLGDDVQQEHTTFPRPSSSRKKGKEEEEEEVENDLEVEKQPRWKGISDFVQDISSTVTSPPGEDPPAFPVYEVQLNHRDPVSTYTFPEDLEPLEPLKPPKPPEVGLNFFQEKTLEVKSPEESCSSGETMGPDTSPRTADFPRYSSSSDSRTLVIREQSDSDASKDTEIRGGSSESYSPGRYNKSSEKSFSSDLLSPVSANSLKYTSVRGTLDLTSAISPFYPIQNSNNEKTPSPRLASGPEERKESSSGKVLGEDSEKKEESWSEESLDYLGDVKYRIRRDSCRKGPYERSYSSLATPMSSEPGDEEMTTAKKRSSDILQDLRHLEARTGEETVQKESLMSKSALSSWEDLKNLEARRRDTFSNSASGFSKYRLAVPGLGLLGKTYHVEPKMSIDEGSDSILKSIATNQGCELEDSKLGVWTKVKPRNRESSGRRSSSDRALKIIQENSAILHKIFACQAKKRLPDLEEISKEITISPINEEISKIFSPILERMGLNEHEINEELARINFKDLDVGNTVPTSVSEFDSKINDELSRLSLIDDPEEEIRNFDDETIRDELIDRKINEELSRLLSDYPDREVTRQLFSPTSNPSRHRLESASSTSSSRFRGLSPRSDIDIYQELEKLDKISSAQSFPVARLDLENQRIPELGLTRVPEVPRISPELLVPRRASRRSELSPDLGIPRLGVLEEKDSSPEVGLPRVRGYRDLQERLSPELTLPISSRTTLQRDLPEMRSFLHSTPYDSGTRSFQFDKSPESNRPALSKEHLEFRVRYDVEERTQQQQQQQQQSSYLTKTSPGDGYPRKDYFRADEKPDSFEFLARSPDFGSYKLPGVKSTGGGGSYGESVKSGFEDTEDTVERYQRYQKSLNLYPGTETPEVGVCSRGFGRSEEETTDGEAKTQFSPFPIRNLIRKPKELGLKLGLYSSSSTTSSSGPLKKS